MYMNSEILRAVYQHELLSEKNLEAVFHAHKKVKFSKGDYILNLGSKTQLNNKVY